MPVTVNAGDWLSLLLRLGLAALAGGVIGWNRQRTGKAAGLRTHMLVSLGAALFVVIPIAAGSSLSEDGLSRAIQGVATGIGFLGAGEIIHLSRTDSSKPKVKGLTSAASIWVTAALGMVAACGLWQASVIGTLMALLILDGAKHIERRISTNEENDD